MMPKSMDKLVAGDKAPEFEAQNFDGKPFRLADYRGKKLWLCFYRYSGCPLCNLHLRELLKRVDQLKAAGIQVIAIFESGPTKDPLPAMQYGIPLLSDPTRAIYKTYGLNLNLLSVLHPVVAATWLQAAFNGIFQKGMGGHLGQLPGHFLVNPDGTLQTAFYGQHIADQIPWSQVDAFASL